MRFLSLLFLCSCSLFPPNPNLDTSPPLPPDAPRESIPKPQDDLKVAIDQTKSYFCIKNAEQFKKEISCEQYSQNIHNYCSNRFKSENQILDCILKSLKI